MNNKHGTLIAFVGSRGSGKTTIANAVYTKLSKSGLRCVRQHRGLKRDPLWRGILMAISLWRFFNFKLFVMLGFVGRKGSLLPSLYRVYMPLAFSSDLHQLANKSADVLIYDSNILIGLISAVAQGKLTEQEVADFYSQNIASRVSRIMLVIVETNPKEAVRRWIERDGVALTEAAFAKAVSDRKEYEVQVNLLLRAIETIPNVTVLRVDGSSMPEVNSDILTKEIIGKQC